MEQQHNPLERIVNLNAKIVQSVDCGHTCGLSCQQLHSQLLQTVGIFKMYVVPRFELGSLKAQ